MQKPYKYKLDLCMHKISNQSILNFIGTDLPKSLITNNLDTFESFFNSFNIDSLNSIQLKIQINLADLKEDNLLIYEKLLNNTERTLNSLNKNINSFILKILDEKSIVFNEGLINYIFNIIDYPALECTPISNYYLNLPSNYLNEEETLNKLILLECKFHLIKQECYILNKIHRCTNSICSKKTYFLEKIDFLNSLILCYSIDTEKKKIEKIFSPPQTCNNCQLNLIENIAERKLFYLYFYTLFNGLFFIQAISFEPLDNSDYILGRIKKYNTNPSLFICGAYKRKPEFYEFPTDYKNNNLIPGNIKSIYKITHSSFEIADLIHTQLHLILSIFLVYKTKITIFTQDCIFLQNYAINFFTTHSCNTQVYLSDTCNDNSLIILNESEITQLTSNFHFFVETNKSFINYSYEPIKIQNSFIKYELSESSVNKIQENYLRLRKVFENNISPIKLLEIVKYLSEGMAALMRQDLAVNDFKVVEHTCTKCIVPDLKVEFMKKKSIYKYLRC